EARLRAVGAGVLRRVRRQAAEAGAGQDHRRVTAPTARASAASSSVRRARSLLPGSVGFLPHSARVLPGYFRLPPHFFRAPSGSFRVCSGFIPPPSRGPLGRKSRREAEMLPEGVEFLPDLADLAGRVAELLGDLAFEPPLVGLPLVELRLLPGRGGGLAV